MEDFFTEGEWKSAHSNANDQGDTARQNFELEYETNWQEYVTKLQSQRSELG